MRLLRQSLPLTVAIVLLCGCQRGPTKEAPKDSSAELATSSTETGSVKDSQESIPAELGDDLDLVAEIEAVATSIKKDSEGFVTEVNYRDSEVTDDKLIKLTELKNLHAVLLNDANISDAGLEPIGSISTLRNLDLRQCPIGNDGLAHLNGLTNLRALRLNGNQGEHGATSVDDGGMESVGKLTNLKALLLDFLWISGEGLSELEDLSNLEELYLAGTLVGDVDLEQMTLFPKLKKLRISKLPQVTGAGLEHVKQLENLIDLDLSENSSLFDADLVHLADMKKLQRLNLWRVAVTDEGIAHLKGLTGMRWLNLDNTQITDAGLDSLSGMSKLEFLHLGSTSVTDEGIQKLSKLKSLKDLKVTRTAVTDAGVEKLQQQLPNTEIQLKYLGDGS